MTGRCSICLVYNSGWLVLEGVNKTVQESLASEHLDSGGVFPVLVLPVVPFITKFNRYIVLGLLVVGKFGNNFKAIPDGFSKKGNYIYKGIMLGMRVEVGRYGAGPQEVVHYSPNWVTWANKERVSRGSEACRCIERHLEWQD